jgi:hypothetical protein
MIVILPSAENLGPSAGIKTSRICVKSPCSTWVFLSVIDERRFSCYGAEYGAGLCVASCQCSCTLSFAFLILIFNTFPFSLTRAFLP